MVPATVEAPAAAQPDLGIAYKVGNIVIRVTGARPTFTGSELQHRDD